MAIRVRSSACFRPRSSSCGPIQQCCCPYSSIGPTCGSENSAIEASPGSSRSRIAGELLSESVGLALAGGALAVLLAWAGLRLLARLAPAGLPRIEEISINPVVLLFTLAISVLTGLVFGLIPVMRFGSPSVVALQEGGRSSSDAPGRHRARNALVVSEIALAFVLLIVSGLMVRSFIALRQVDPGFVRPKEVQTFRV